MTGSARDSKLRTELDPATAQEVVSAAMAAIGLSVQFEQNSNAEVHFHLYLQPEGEMTMGSKFTDASSGATGAKSFGHGSRGEDGYRHRTIR